jgi:hypothetical protein
MAALTSTTAIELLQSPAGMIALLLCLFILMGIIALLLHVEDTLVLQPRRERPLPIRDASLR